MTDKRGGEVLIGHFLVDESGLAPESYRFCLSFLHTYSAFKLKQISPTDGKNLPHTAKFFQLRAVKRN